MTGAAPLRVLIVDDEPLARARARRLLGKIGDVEVVGEAANGREALDLVESLQPDLVLLDIQMPGLDGLRVLEALDDPPAIVFSTAHEEFAVRAFELEAVDYLLKPYSAERLGRAIERVRRLLSGSGASREGPTQPVRIPALDGLTTDLVPAERVLVFEILEGVVFLLRDDGERLVCEQTLNELEQALPADTFFRINRQAIVNLARIESYKPAKDGGLLVRLPGGHTQLASRRRAPHLRARLA